MEMGMLIRGVDKLERVIKRTRLEQEKASNTAIRIEGYRKKNLLQKELRKGAPGGRQFAPLSFIARRLWYPPERRVPLYSPVSNRYGKDGTIDKAVRYHVQSERPYTLALGFVGPTSRSKAELARKKGLKRGIDPEHISSVTWRRLALKHQAGFVAPVSSSQRLGFAHIGAALGTIEGGRTPFFLKKSTTHMRTPARPIISPFRIRYRREIVRNIANHYAAKMAGRRVS